jgi:hypothetical protein
MKRQKMKRAKRTLSARSLVALGVGAIIELDCSGNLLQKTQVQQSRYHLY